MIYPFDWFSATMVDHCHNWLLMMQARALTRSICTCICRKNLRAIFAPQQQQLYPLQAINSMYHFLPSLEISTCLHWPKGNTSVKIFLARELCFARYGHCLYCVGRRKVIVFLGSYATTCVHCNQGIYRSARRIFPHSGCWHDHITSHHQGEDAHHDTCFVLRALRGCCKKHPPKYWNNVLSSSETPGNYLLFTNHFHILPFDVWITIFCMVLLQYNTNKPGAIFFFHVFVRKSGSNLVKTPQKREINLPK